MSQTPTPSTFDQPAPPAKGMALAGLIISIVACCVPVLGFVGIILGIVALVRAKSDPRRYGGSGMALAAIIVGAVSLIVSFLFILLLGMAFPVIHQLKKVGNRHADAVEFRVSEPPSIRSLEIDARELFNRT